MDNASFHHANRIEQMCSDAGVSLVYLPPYSPDLNPIEVLLSDKFLEWCVDVVATRTKSVEGHFRHAGLGVEEM